MRSTRGLTLIELMIAIAVLAILTTLAAPTLAERLDRQRLESIAQTLALDLAESRVEAVEAGQPLFVVFDRSPAWCYAVARSADCGCDAPRPCQLKVERAADWPGVALQAAEDARFDAVGTPAGGARARFRSSTGGEELAVSLSPLGRARICADTARWGYGAC